MGRRGPKPKHPEIEKLEGHRSHDHAPRSAINASGIAMAPERLSDEAKVIWFEIMESMPPGFYTRVDVPLLTTFCEAWSLHREASHMIREEGAVLYSKETGVPYQHPWLGIMNKQAQMIATLGDRLGLSPSARVGLKVDNTKPPSKIRSFIAAPKERKRSSTSLNA